MVCCASKYFDASWYHMNTPEFWIRSPHIFAGTIVSSPFFFCVLSWSWGPWISYCRLCCIILREQRLMLITDQCSILKRSSSLWQHTTIAKLATCTLNLRFDAKDSRTNSLFILRHAQNIKTRWKHTLHANSGLIKALLYKVFFWEPVFSKHDQNNISNDNKSPNASLRIYY